MSGAVRVDLSHHWRQIINLPVDPNLYLALCQATVAVILLPGPMFTLIVALASDGPYAVLAGRLSQLFSNHRWAHLRNRVLGTVLMATGAGLTAS